MNRLTSLLPNKTYHKQLCDIADFCGFKNCHATISEAEEMLWSCRKEGPEYGYALFILMLVIR